MRLEGLFETQMVMEHTCPDNKLGWTSSRGTGNPRGR